MKPESSLTYLRVKIYPTERGFKIFLKKNDRDIIGGGGGGVLPIMAYTGRLRPKGVPFSGFRYIKG